MPEYTQANRPVRVDTQLGPDVLLLGGFNGQEAISELFSFQLDLLSTQLDIDAQEVLRKPMVLTVNLAGGERRKIHGLTSRFTELGRADDLAFYRAEIVPWLWFLTLSRNCRIFQEESVPDIIEKVFKELGYSDFEFRLSQSYAPRLYCVQYRETDFNFISRLMEEEGIFYFFEHSDEKHVLVLADSARSFAEAPAAAVARYTTDASHMEESISEWEHEHSIQPGKVTLWDYDFQQPALKLEATLGEEPEEIYDYHPETFTSPDEGERQARLRLEIEEAERRVVRGESNVKGFLPGFRFKLEEHYRRAMNGKYVLTAVQHSACAGQYRAWDNDAALDYHNIFHCIPESIPYRTARRTLRPVVRGTQTAIVVGPAGEEVYVDKYGRIKVQFYWDREGKRDENSSCWIRYASPWAGKGYGSVTVPRIGNEVVVAFLEGDPDRPIIVGSVYNADQMPPFELPGSGIQMGMKSRSSPGGGGYNEVTVMDKQGGEVLNMHAQYNMVTVVENDQTLTVHNNRSGTIDVNDTLKVGVNQTIEIGADRDVIVGGNDALIVSGNHGRDITGNENVDTLGNQQTQISGERTAWVGGNDSVDCQTNIEHKAAVNIALEAGVQVGAKGGALAQVEAPTVVIKGSVVQIHDGMIAIQGQIITLSAGGSTIVIGPDGITLSGPMINSIAGGMNKVMGGVVMIN